LALGRWYLYCSIYKSQLIFSIQRNRHRPAPGGIIVAFERLGDQHQSWVVRMVEKKRIEGIVLAFLRRLFMLHNTGQLAGKIGARKKAAES
jgi:hypothetical protein